ncbi:ABC transporter permease [Ulvibacter litoralis]|uniref:ABC-type transport system involved in multi-copper enzyme maturation, permease component n=1 Tax=Ulvibacter litoralis TaxID=227084 RepID=A0A1G7ENI6_9FLAO|nr:ABC transporter permease [Ulvibacter litoralis]GHC54458.1 ABC transporter permease [Ulvibacter litoralis]SDE65209.1 ABC-type transport system involved in multi-copper enzyme maturation, permease component [Ulvibacter litoralis]
MLRLLNIELQKIKYNKAAKIISIVYFSLICFIAFIVSIEFNFGGINFRVADQGIFNFPFIWHFNSWMAAWLKIFLAIVIVSIVANEYSYRTLKQNLIDGLSKKEFIISKVLTVVLFSIVSTVFLFIVSLTLGLIFSDYTEFSIIFSDLEYLFAYFLKLICFFSFCMFLAFWVKRSAFALGFLGLWQVIEGLIAILFQFIKVKTDVNLFDSVYNFLPLNAMSDLITEPFSRLGAVQSAANQLGENFNQNYDVQWSTVLITMGWTVLFIYGSYAILKRRDL